MSKSERGIASIFGIDVDRITRADAVSRVYDWVKSGERKCRYVVTPNLDHAVQFQSNAELRDAYSEASMVVADGWPLVSASRMFRDPLPERVTGSDIVPGIFDYFSERNEKCRVFLLGAAEGVAETAASRIHKQWSGVRVVGTCSPPFGFEQDETELQKIIGQVNKVNPDLLIVGFGAPKQEKFLKAHHRKLSVGVAIAAGATIDFFAGRQKRAPVWVQRMRLEWTHRLLTNPRRLFGRYARNAFEFPRLLYREHLSRRVRSV